MTENKKQTFLNHSILHVEKVRKKLITEIQNAENEVKFIEEKLKNPSSGEGHVKEQMRLMYYARLNTAEENLDQYKALHHSPYFVRCDIKFKGRPGISTFYFGKFGFQEENIYSWIVPAAVMRFEEPGEFSYKSPNGNLVEAELLRKDQFMIVDGKIVYMTTESKEEERQLVHQEFMPERKSSFVLPEIIRQMEKSQDQVIRAHHKGSFLISGPAGSGKTTLALHRVAYLTQSPETTNLYKNKQIIVFVQDKSSKEYFGGLLPNLGINDVKVTTFPEWTQEILNLPEFKFVYRYGESEEERDLLEYYKTESIKNFNIGSKNIKDRFSCLQELYKSSLPQPIYEIIEKQLQENLVDRFDMTLMLKKELTQNGLLAKEKVKYGNRKVKGRYQRTMVKEPLNYALIIVDEVQNYLADQLAIIKKHVDKDTQAMLYVGDLAQQTQLSTLQDWAEISEEFSEKRKAVLEKVYRNTRQILEYIGSVGYRVVIPEGIKEGREVQEVFATSKDEELKYTQKIVENNTEAIIGILAKDHDYLYEFESLFREKENVHIRTINEAQGVEFDIVLLVGVNKANFLLEGLNNQYPHGLLTQKYRVNKDLIYVALTRAISELHILGEAKLKDVVGQLQSH